MTPKEQLQYDIFLLFKYGKIKEAETMMVDNNLDYLEVSPADKWNWLHQLLMGFSEKKPSLESIKFLIDKGVPVNAQNSYGKTPLLYAMRSQNTDAAILFLENGADPNIHDKKMNIL